MNKMPTHELDGWGSIPVRGNYFFFRRHIQTGSGVDSLPLQGYRGLYPWSQNIKGVTLTTYLGLETRSVTPRSL
jgi:hypothetical protein